MSPATVTPQPGDVDVAVAVVGAGPAGLAAAVTAAESGARVALVDAATQPGGQYWRHPSERHPRGDEAQGQHDWTTFTDLRARLTRLAEQGRIAYLPGTQVWFAEPVDVAGSVARWALQLTPSPGSPPTRATVVAGSLVLCPGGYDRQLPVPGWDLPGVLAAGGVQALLKGHRTLAGRRAVVAGTGPFLLPVAAQLAAAGAEVVAVCEANSPAGWLREVPAVAAAPAKLVEGAGYAATLLRRRIPYRTRTVVTAVQPDDTGQRAGSVTVTRVDAAGRPRGETRDLAVDLVAFGWGFTPSLELLTAVGAATRLDVDRSLVAEVDAYQRSSRGGVLVAGEATGVGGAALAVAEGRLAGLVAAGVSERDPLAGRLRRRIRRLRRFAVAMHRAHPVPAEWTGWLRDDTLVCRCEEVDVAAIRHAGDSLGATDARTVKLLARPGMGWCQGRVCGFAVACLAGAAQGRAVGADDLRAFAKRTLVTPVTLRELAAARTPAGTTTDTTNDTKDATKESRDDG